MIIVDLYGESADWDSLLPICRKYGVPVIEDAAEALGTVYKGKSALPSVTYRSYHLMAIK